ncbi:FIP (Fungus-Induced Protein) Related [Caenorhabditis elegans]|uniref:FIP (Fungus-Induced Protein) Related n=1 Tax=Caenorhabditis elegans TaxID=6239 RepID=Q9N4K6_CAEEL|nr:FIP (Fungus-Induced Protein) Related [Caenorhabditis elegans]CCD64687.1 FIP (Fungus-Induced Protein) Related [Caenorhabditis elegans]|eukprot:NP_494096.1 Uncharacterized protein CELE_C52E2.2 [Caenorhabditis elegans]
MNFIVYLLVLIAWAPSFGLSQGSPAAGSAAPTGGVNAGVDVNAEIEDPETGLFVGILGSGFGGSGKGGLF